MKIALIQTNPVIGDFEYNCDKIVSYANKALEDGCSVVIFPEMAISGYPPQDLLERKSFVEDHDYWLGVLLKKLPTSLYSIFGCIEKRKKSSRGKPLYNSAFVVYQSKVIHKIRKRLLPSYDVFDETRYFEPGTGSNLVSIKDSKSLKNYTIGINICEDLWHEKIEDHHANPVGDLISTAIAHNKKMDFLVNISASPYQIDKETIRRSVFQSVCRKYNLPLLYINQVGGQDSLVFDGRSMVMSRTGEILAQGAGFTVDMMTVETESLDKTGFLPIKENESEKLSSLLSSLVLGVRDYVRKSGFNSAIIGLSGGIDSALTAFIAVKALGAKNVLGVAMPSPYSSGDSLEDARQLSENLGCGFEIIPIENMFRLFNETMAPLFNGLDEDLTEQNIQARLRGNILMAISNKFGHMLLTTGNKSEMAVGYCTLYGDMCGGLAVISDVPKQLVYDLSRFVNQDKEYIPVRTITKPPTAELKPDQCDQDDLPEYEVLDKILEYHLEDMLGEKEIIEHGFEEKVVVDILRRVRINEYKRKQAPMGLKVTSKAFGYGRRYPNVQNYRG